MAAKYYKFLLLEVAGEAFAGNNADTAACRYFIWIKQQFPWKQ